MRRDVREEEELDHAKHYVEHATRERAADVAGHDLVLRRAIDVLDHERGLRLVEKGMTGELRLQHAHRATVARDLSREVIDLPAYVGELPVHPVEPELDARMHPVTVEEPEEPGELAIARPPFMLHTVR